MREPTPGPLRLPAGPPVGLGWRAPLAGFVAGLLERPEGPAIGFSEVVAESIPDPSSLPEPLQSLRRHGLPVVPHGVSLSLGGAEPPQPARIEHLGALAAALGAPLVSEHIAFVRAPVSGRVVEAGHLLPIPRTPESLEALVRNIRLTQERLHVPLALEPVAALLDLGGMSEPEFLTEVVERTGAWLVLDLANVYANARNGGSSVADILDGIPLERVAYCHVAGGRVIDGLYRDTHVHPLPDPVVRIVADLSARARSLGILCPPVLLERDGSYPSADELTAELTALGRAVTRPMRAPDPPAASDLPPPAADVPLAQVQSELVAALTCDGACPDYLDRGRVGATRRQLLDKRSGLVADHLSNLRAALGDRWHQAFSAWATGRPSGGVHADAVEFAQSLRGSGVVDERAVATARDADLGTPDGRRARLTRFLRR